MSDVSTRKVRDLYNARVPKEHLDKMGIAEGDILQYECEDDHLIVRKFTGASA